MPSGHSAEGENVSEIQALTNRVQELSQSVDFWNAVMLCGLFFAALTAAWIVVSTRLVIVRTGQQATAQGLLDAAKDRQFQADLKAKDIEIGNLKSSSDMAEKQISDTNLRAAGLEVEAARLRLQLVSQQRRSDILLDPKSRPEFIAQMKEFAGQQFDMAVCGLKESETAYLSMALWSTLGGAGWSVGVIDMNSPSCTEWIGVWVNPNASLQTRAAAKALADALAERGLTPKGAAVGTIPAPPTEPRAPNTWFMRSSSQDSILIMVGTHP